MTEYLTTGKTPRGFATVTFTDRYGTECSIQKSSLATEDAIWIGAKRLVVKRFKPDYTGWHDVDFDALFPGQTISGNERMHLTQDQVRELLPILTRFAETGEIEISGEDAHD